MLAFRSFLFVYVLSACAGYGDVGAVRNLDQGGPYGNTGTADPKQSTASLSILPSKTTEENSEEPKITNVSLQPDELKNKENKSPDEAEEKDDKESKAASSVQKHNKDSTEVGDAAPYKVYHEMEPEINLKAEEPEHQYGHEGRNESSNTSMSSHNDSNHEHEHESGRYHVAVFDFNHIAIPFIGSVWVLLASVAKIGFHLNNKLSSIFPESCLLILLGILVGLLLHYCGLRHYELDATMFFLVLLPPIILDAGYHMPMRSFFDNLGTILVFAIVNTIFNTLLIGLSLWGFTSTGWIPADLELLHCFTYASLISAVDPVAVLATFEEVNVHEMLYIIVFGESLLNDAVSVVLYHLFEGFSHMGAENIIAVDIVAGIASFIINSVCSTLIGIIMGTIAAFITRFTDHVRVIEPITVFLMGYLAYLSAELFHFSGILACCVCGLSMKKYVEANISAKSRTTIKYCLKMLASISETVIFLYLGLSTVSSNHDWNAGFIILTVFFCLLYRAIGVVLFAWIMNRKRLIKLNPREQFIMAYGGLRGAIAFSLASLLPLSIFPRKRLFITTTVVVILFTVFLLHLCLLILWARLGITIKPLVNFLDVKKADVHKLSMNEWVYTKLVDHTLAGIEDIIGSQGPNILRARFADFDHKYLKRFLIRERLRMQRGVSMFTALQRMNEKEARDYIKTHGSYANFGTLAYSHSSVSVSALNQENLPHSESEIEQTEEGEGEPKVTFRLGDPDDHDHDHDQVAINIEASQREAGTNPISHVDTAVDLAALQLRKTYLRYRRHTLTDEADEQTPYHHNQRLHLRRALAKMVHRHHRHHNRHHNHRHHKAMVHLEVPQEEFKVKKNVSFADQPIEGKMLEVAPNGPPAEQVLKVTSGDQQSEGKTEVTSDGTEDVKSTEAAPSGVTFTLASDSDSEMNSAKNGSDQSGEEEAEPAEPTAVEVSLPWKRNTGRPPISSSFTHSFPDENHPRMSEAPSWVDNENYVAVPEPLPYPPEPVEMTCTSCLHLQDDTSDSGMHADCICHDTDTTDAVLPPPWKSNNGNNHGSQISQNGEKVNGSHHGSRSSADRENGNWCKHTGYRDSHDANCSLPPLPWKRPIAGIPEVTPIRSPSASNDHDPELCTSSLRPQFSSHSLRLSEAESRHSEHVHLPHVMDLPSHHSCPAFSEWDLPSDDEQDTHDRVQAWLLDVQGAELGTQMADLSIHGLEYLAQAGSHHDDDSPFQNTSQLSPDANLHKSKDTPFSDVSHNLDTQSNASTPSNMAIQDIDEAPLLNLGAHTRVDLPFSDATSL